MNGGQKAGIKKFLTPPHLRIKRRKPHRRGISEKYREGEEPEKM